MTNQLVKKSRTDKRKRKGYGGWETAKGWGKGIGSQAAWCALDPAACMNMVGAIFGMKKGGRVKGVGKATHGFGRAMRKQKK